MMPPGDIEAIDRATVAAVSPHAQEELAGWLLAFDAGTVGRARSAVPLSHEPPPGAILDEIQSRYAAHGLPPMLRLPLGGAFAACRDELARRGWEQGKPTHVQVAQTEAVMRVSEAPLAATRDAPDDAWAAVFLGEGFDPVDGASRVATLRRAPGALFATIEQDGAAVAAGMGAFSHGWASVHGMRTALAQRGRGLAARVLATFARAAQGKGIARMFLQVEAHNASALALYRRAGFTTAWTYSYWTKP